MTVPLIFAALTLLIWLALAVLAVVIHANVMQAPKQRPCAWERRRRASGRPAVRLDRPS